MQNNSTVDCSRVIAPQAKMVRCRVGEEMPWHHSILMECFQINLWYSHQSETQILSSGD